MWRISLDASSSNIGIFAVNTQTGKALSKTVRLYGDEHKAEPFDRAGFLFDRFQSWAIQAHIKKQYVSLIAIERPCVQGNQTIHSLIPLAEAFGFLYAELSRTFTRATIITQTPAQYKGQLSKDRAHERFLKITRQNRNMLEAFRSGDEHARDAAFMLLCVDSRTRKLIGSPSLKKKPKPQKKS